MNTDIMSEIAFPSSTSKSGEAACPRVLSYLQKNLSTLHPAYFGLVMASGIVSIDCRVFELKDLSNLLFVANTFIYVLLWFLYLSRSVFFSGSFLADWYSHKRSFGFFTIIAATNVLGTQTFLTTGNAGVASGLWWLGLLLWLLCTYSIFVFLIVKKDKPGIEEGINGGWLLSVVATQSICVLGAQLRPLILGDADFSILLLLSFWLFGGMLYVWLIALIFYRYLFFKFEASDLIPPYWINMGAMAITTLAGCELVRAFGTSPFVANLLPFLKGLTLMYWATATWWIPMLLVLGVWRHGIRRFKFSYDPLYWGLVFPLAMYSVCTYKLSLVLQIPGIQRIAQLFLILGLVAWFLTFLSMAQRPLYVLILTLRGRRAANHTYMEDASNGCDG